MVTGRGKRIALSGSAQTTSHQMSMSRAHVLDAGDQTLSFDEFLTMLPNRVKAEFPEDMLKAWIGAADLE